MRYNSFPPNYLKPEFRIVPEVVFDGVTYGNTWGLVFVYDLENFEGAVPTTTTRLNPAIERTEHDTEQNGTISLWQPQPQHSPLT